MEIGFDGIVRPSVLGSAVFQRGSMGVSAWTGFDMSSDGSCNRRDSGSTFLRGNPSVFPLISGMNLTQSLAEARLDLDTRSRISPRIQLASRGSGPLFLLGRIDCLESLSAHTSTTSTRTGGNRPMDLFERIDVEGNGVSVGVRLHQPARRRRKPLPSHPRRRTGTRRLVVVIPPPTINMRPTAEACAPHDYKSAIRADFRGAQASSTTRSDNKRREALPSSGICAA